MRLLKAAIEWSGKNVTGFTSCADDLYLLCVRGDFCFDMRSTVNTQPKWNVPRLQVVSINYFLSNSPALSSSKFWKYGHLCSTQEKCWITHLFSSTLLDQLVFLDSNRTCSKLLIKYPPLWVPFWSKLRKKGFHSCWIPLWNLWRSFTDRSIT